MAELLRQPTPEPFYAMAWYQCDHLGAPMELTGDDGENLPRAVQDLGFCGGDTERQGEVGEYWNFEMGCNITATDTMTLGRVDLHAKPLKACKEV